MNTLTVLVLTPFNSSGREIQHRIRKALEDAGVDVIRLDDIRPGALWSSAVTDAIKKADFIIADITDQNPNIIYEIGYAHALEKIVFLLVSREVKGDIPSDLTGYHYLIYADTYEINDLVRGRIIPYFERLRRLGDHE